MACKVGEDQGWLWSLVTLQRYALAVARSNKSSVLDCIVVLPVTV